MIRNIVRFLLPPLVTLLAGCTIVDSSSIPLGQRLPPISPSHVQIYNSPPGRYDEIAIVSAKAGHDFKSDQSVMASAIQRLKAEAAAMGANGILLQNVHTRSEPTVTTGFGTATVYGAGGVATASGTTIGVSHGDGYSKVSGIAIYVHPDSPRAPAASVDAYSASAQRPADLGERCQAIRDEIFNAPKNNPSMTEDEKARLRSRWREMGCAEFEAGTPADTSASRTAEVSPAAPTAAPVGSGGGQSLGFDQCFQKCQELTDRSDEQCFDACK
jgi:hypothetical protein